MTGAVSGIWVLDTDGPEGEEALGKLGFLPKTRACKTPRGLHRYFRHPGCKVRTISGLFDKVDVRGDGGYVVGPDSVRENGATYQWTEDSQPVADAPVWLLKRVADPNDPKTPACIRLAEWVE